MRSGPRGDGLFWDRAMILYAIDLWVRRTGRPPAANEWDRAREDYPSRQTVQRVFGRWNTAIEAAGYLPRKPGSHRVRSRVMQRDAQGRFLPRPSAGPR